MKTEKKLMNVKSAISHSAISSETSSSSIRYKIRIQLQHPDEPCQCRTLLQHKISFFTVITVFDPSFTAKVFEYEMMSFVAPVAIFIMFGLF